MDKNYCYVFLEETHYNYVMHERVRKQIKYSETKQNVQLKEVLNHVIIIDARNMS